MTGERKKRETGRILRRYLPAALVLAGAVALLATGTHRSLSFEAFVRHQDDLRQLVEAHRLGMLGIYALIYVSVVTLSVPASAFMTVIGGYLFGWALGGSVAAVSATLGATNIFLIARSSLGEPLLHRAGPRIQGLAAGFRRQAFSYLLFLRLMPIMPFWITNLAAAFFGMRLQAFVIATQIGMIPVSFAFAFAGSGLDDVIATQKQMHAQCLARGGTACKLDFSAESLLTPELMITLAILGVLSLAPVLFRWRQRGS